MPDINRYFRIFKIKKITDISKQELVKRYRILSLKYHPDKGGTNKNFITINEAYIYLMELHKKTMIKENKKFFNSDWYYCSNGNIYDIKKKRWIKIKKK